MQPGFVLHRRRYGDTSLLLDVFSRDAGRLSLIAKGALGKRHRGASGLEPFVPLLLEWRGRGEVHTLTGFDTADDGARLAGTRLYCGFYLNELLTRLLPRHDPHVELFANYAAALHALVTDPVEPVLRYFERDLLDQLGLGMRLDADLDGEVLHDEGAYRYDPEQGAIPCGAADPAACSGASLRALGEGRLVPGQLREVRRLMRRVLAHYLGDRPLKSREMLTGLPGGNER